METALASPVLPRDEATEPGVHAGFDPPALPALDGRVSPLTRRRATAVHRLMHTYRGRALVSPWHGLGLVAVVLVSLRWPVVALLAALPVLEVSVWGLLPRIRWFRRSVDRSDAALREERRKRRRERLLTRISLEHRQELERFEALLEILRYRTDEDGAAVRFRLDERLPFRSLLSRFYRLALAHQDLSSLLKLTFRDVPTAPLRGRAAVIETERQAQRARNREALDQLSEEMQAIGGLIHLALERAAEPPAGTRASDVITGFLDELDEHRSAVQLLVELRAEVEEAAWDEASSVGVTAQGSAAGLA